MQGSIAGLSKWEPRSYSRIYLGHSPFHGVSVALVLNPETSHVSPQLCVVFDDEFSTVPFIREVTITPNWTDLVKCISQSGAPGNIEPKDTWLTPDLEEDPK